MFGDLSFSRKAKALGDRSVRLAARMSRNLVEYPITKQEVIELLTEYRRAQDGLAWLQSRDEDRGLRLMRR